ncbi:WecB/TagA/CpsF family glycosyltransferase [Reinekea sp.]|uniref:WecB/TagA/CpsF family glycosyltransferase n=1 Tax=Reinekea sp. TaxID=1970455 RepID=UPI002A80CE24|nr:WecB/TagA/CpsF family glycosyltransferase [Reinekea sp.]
MHKNQPSIQPKLERLLDLALACVAMLMLSPVWLTNLLMSVWHHKLPLVMTVQQDVLGREQRIYQWQRGFFPTSAALLNVASGSLSLFGVSLNSGFGSIARVDLHDLKAGLYSIAEIQQRIGLIGLSVEQSMLHHQAQRSIGLYLNYILKGLFCSLLYRTTDLRAPASFTLFGIRIDNFRMAQAVDLICADTPDTPDTGSPDGLSGRPCKVVNFINVNSINLAYSNRAFKNALNRANCTLADGSGVRLGARSMQVQLKDNINGTDLMPMLCAELVARKLSLYLFGSAPGVAQKAADALKASHPGLIIAGVQHGRLTELDNDQVVAAINASQADVCLVALGSPVQEHWIMANRTRLEVRTAIAVGGLFDFLSGNIPRAPLWMRELGLEWVFRLIQEPRVKFTRYVIGNPLFLWRAFVLKKSQADS